MPSLTELQTRFAAAILDGDDGFLAAVAPGGAAAAQRLEVYRNNARHSFRDALRAVYPVVELLVGAEFFAFAADRYRVAQPSRSGDIHRYGDRFGDFLAAFAPAAGLPYLPDMARLEWAMHEVFHAADTVPFGCGQLAGADPETFVFQLSPDCRLLHSAYPVDRLWEMHQPGAVWDEAFDPAGGGGGMLVRRAGYEVAVERPGAAGFAMLAALAAGAGLGAGYEAARRLDAGFDLGTFLLRYLPALCPASDRLRTGGGAADKSE